MAKPLRIFISSPGDVASERRRAALVIEKLAKDYARFFDIKPYLWETEPMLASGHFQDAIVPPGETDILVLILWARLGTPLPDQKYRGIDGRVPVTGTEWEFEAALAAHKQSGVPDLLAYKKMAAPKAEYNSDADLEELRRQLQKFDSFWSRYFVGQGEFRAAFGEFEDLDGFEAKLDSDLRRLIERRVAALKGDTGKPVSPTWLTGSPFRGLETYRFEHAPIFFGRSEATKSAVEHLVENAEAGRSLLLVLGASGAGKSSLAQAGIVPALGVRGVVPRVGAWRRAVMRPGGHPGGPFMALAAALAGEDALPEVLQGQDAAALARHLEAASTDPSFPIVAALSAREQAARQKGDLLSFEEVRLILVVDQLEELFTLGEITPDQRKSFILCLKGLMDSRRVFVIATMRSDYWHRAAETPLLVALAEGHGRLDLLPPTQAEITEMIRRPAEVAGLTFETEPRTEIGLDAALAEEASREPGALPLLSFLLDALYVKDVQEGAGSTLRYTSMDALGGLKGAIATRAEAAFTALPAEAQAALPRVLRALVTVSRSGAEPTARAVAMTRFAEGSAERRVVEAFLDPQVRLLVADGDGDGARVRLAHEALITHWQRAKDQLLSDRRDLETRTVVELQLARWREASGRAQKQLLIRDPDLANALDLQKRWGNEIDADTRDFIGLSHRRVRFQHRLTLAAAAVFALLAVAASVLGGLALHSKQQVEQQRGLSAVAEANRRAALSQQLASAGRTQVAAAVALDAAPAGAGDAKPLPPALDIAIRRTLDLVRIPVERFLGDNVFNMALSQDGKTLAAGTVKGEVYILDASSLQERFHFKGGTDVISGLDFSPDGKRIVASGDKIPTVWDVTSGRKLFELTRENTRRFVKSAKFSSDGRRIVAGTSENRALVYDGNDGKLLHVLPGPTFEEMVDRATEQNKDGFGVADPIMNAVAHATWQIWGAATEAVFSPDGKTIAVTGPANPDGSVRLFDTQSGRLVRTLTGGTGAMLSAMGYGHTLAFSPDGMSVIAAPTGTTIKIWNVKDGLLRVEFPTREVNSFVLTADGQAVVSAQSNGSLIIRCIGANSAVASIQAHDGSIETLSVDPERKWLATGSTDRSARVWRMPKGPDICVAGNSGKRDEDAISLRRPVAIFPGHGARITQALFTGNGQTLITSSQDGWVRAWPVAPQGVSAPLDGESDPIAVSGDGRTVIAYSTHEYEWSAWDAATARPIKLPERAKMMAPGAPQQSAVLLDTPFSRITPAELAVRKELSSQNNDWWSWGSRVSADGTRAVIKEEAMKGQPGNNLDGLPKPVGLSPEDIFVLVDGNSKAVLARLVVGDRPATGVFFSPDGSRVFGRLEKARDDKSEYKDSGDGMAVWNAASGKQIAVAAKIVGYSISTQMIVSETGKRALLWDSGPKNMFDIAQDQFKALAIPFTGASFYSGRSVTSAALSRDGADLIAGHNDGTIALVGIGSNETRRTFDTRGLAITFTAMSPDGKYVAAADKSDTLWVFDNSAGELVRSATFPDEIKSLQFFPQSDRLLVATGANFTVLSVVPKIAGLTDSHAIIDWAHKEGLNLVSAEDRRRYKLGDIPGASTRADAQPWAALDPNSEATSKVVWGKTAQEARDKASAACKEISHTCSSQPTVTNDLEGMFVLMCCTNPGKSCATSAGSPDAALRSVKQTFATYKFSNCAVRFTMSARDGARH